MRRARHAHSRILLIGPRGRLGIELCRALPRVGELVAVGRDGIDLAAPHSIREALARVRPDVVVNAAAGTDIERAEDDEAGCRAVNEIAPAILAEECRRRGAALVHYSTDYVFDGRAPRPYRESDVPAPLNAYGRAKLAGEQAIEDSGAACVVLRCTWMFGEHGRNFVQTIRRLARERRELVVVDDQVGSPTWTREIAAATARILTRALATAEPAGEALRPHAGTYHLSASGQTNRYDFAVRILVEDSGRDEHVFETIRATSTEAYGERAPRPKYSVLDNTKIERAFGVALPPWDEQLRAMLRQSSHPMGIVRA